MFRARRLFRPILGLGLFAGMLGCVTAGRPLDGPRAIPGEAVARGPDVPLVPVPPPPLGTEAASGTSPPAKPAPPPLTVLPPPTPIAESTPIAASAPATPARPALAPAPAPRSDIPVTARQLYRTATERYATNDSYIVRLTRREQVKDKMNPEEVLLMKFRKEPWSVYLKWLGKEGQGREVVYVRGQHEGKIHTLLAAGDIPFVPAGRRMALLPDSILVRSACRHPITEAGIGASIARIGLLIAANETGDRRHGTLTLLTAVRRPEFDQAVNALENSLPPGADSSLPKGGKRTWFFNPNSGLPTLSTAVDDRGQLVEYYRYDRFLVPVKLDDSDFDPDTLWGKPRTTTTAGR